MKKHFFNIIIIFSICWLLISFIALIADSVTNADITKFITIIYGKNKYEFESYEKLYMDKQGNIVITVNSKIFSDGFESGNLKHWRN